MDERQIRKPKKRRGSILGRILSLVLVTVLCLTAGLVGVIWVLEKGPSPTVTGMFCRSVRETSAIRWVSELFLSEEELAQYKTANTEQLETEAVNTSLIHIAQGSRAGTADGAAEAESVELVQINEGNCKGWMIIARDPKQVQLGISSTWFGEDAAGLLLTDIVAKYDAIGGINAGGFNDEDGFGDGGEPQGLVLYDGQILWGGHSTIYNIVGLDGDGILHVGTMSGTEALELGIRWAVSFVTHDGQSSTLIVNGEVQTANLGSGVNPRTAIGQRADGALLLLVLDGRSINTLGASMQDVCDIMLEYGAVNAGNLDGGSSTVMVWDGEIINHCASVTGPRRIPTAFVVLGEHSGTGAAENG